MRRITGIFVTIIAFASALPAWALSDADVIEWVGRGDNTVYVVVDFASNPSGTIPDAFIYGVRFEAATITGLEALSAVAAETNLAYTDAGGGFVTDISYSFRNTTYSGSGEFPPWWSYWESTDGGSSWVLSSAGVAAHVMSDGDASGWQHNWDTAWPPTLAPTGPYFEPNSMDADVVEWAGRGGKCAYVVVDFSDSTTQSAEFVFGVSFTSGTITGLDALNMLQNETGLTITDSGGGFITHMRYAFRGVTYEGAGDFPPWWSYWESVNSGTDWALSSVGCAGHALDNFDASGWVNTWDTGWPATVYPNGPRLTPGPAGFLPVQGVGVVSDGQFYAGRMDYGSGSWDGIDAWYGATVTYAPTDDAWTGVFLYDYDTGGYVRGMYALGALLQ